MRADEIEKSGFVQAENDMSNVFEWVDPQTKDKKVTVVMTLPSGVNKNDCEINLTTGDDDSGTSTEVVVKIPWSARFCDSKTIFWKADADKSYGMHPEALEYERSINRFRLNNTHVPKAVYKIKLPSAVQTNPMTISSIQRSFNPVAGGDKNNPKQNVLIIRMTGLRDNFAATHISVGDTYDSD